MPTQVPLRFEGGREREGGRDGWMERGRVRDGREGGRAEEREGEWERESRWACGFLLCSFRVLSLP